MGEAVTVFVSECDSEIREGYPDWIRVPPAYRRRGIGALLMNETRARLTKIADFATVAGPGHDAAAYPFYISTGFEGGRRYMYENRQRCGGRAEL